MRSQKPTKPSPLVILQHIADCSLAPSSPIEMTLHRRHCLSPPSVIVAAAAPIRPHTGGEVLKGDSYPLCQRVPLFSVASCPLEFGLLLIID